MPVVRDPSGRLLLGGVDLAALLADTKLATPAYVYDVDAMAGEASELEGVLAGSPHLVAYAVKANSAGRILRALALVGCGADVVSGGELQLALGCSIPPDRIVFSGVAKTDEEIDRAIASGPHGICAIQVESLEELDRVAARARALGKRARVSLRVNPGVERGALSTHDYIATGHDEAKFGIMRDDVSFALTRVSEAKEIALVGFTSHVGSQFTETGPYVASARALFDVVRSARSDHGAELTFVDTGGGFGVDYGEGCRARPADFVRAAQGEQRAAGLGDLALFVEPGRSLVATHGVLVATVIQKKVGRRPPRGRWLMIDAGMNDLIRPALYQARHRVVALACDAAASVVDWKVVGPVCESSDDFGVHPLPEEPARHVALLDAGAYGYTMASRYNGRALASEIFLQGGRVSHVRPRQSTDAWVRDRLDT